MRRPSRGPRLLLFALILGVAVAFFSLAQTNPQINDTIGYAFAGQQIASGHGLALVDSNELTGGAYFSMFAYPVEREGDLRPFFGFPPGLPLLLGAGALLSGNMDAVYYVVPLLAVAGLIMTYLLGTELGKNEWVGLWAALLLAVTPAYWRFGTAPWSEVPSLFFIAAGVYLYLRSRRALGAHSVSPLILSFLAALFLGYSFFLRYTNVLVVPALGLYELWSARQKLWQERQRWSFFFFLGIALAAIPLFNHFYYGGPFLTSYSPVHGWYPQPAFSLSYALGPSFVNGFSLSAIGRSLWQNFYLLLFLVPIGWLLLPRAAGILSAGASLATFALYAVYAFAAGDVNSRFLLPVFPFLTVAMARALVAIGARLPGRRLRIAGGALLLALLSLFIPQHVNFLEARAASSRALVTHVETITGGTEQDAVFLSYVYNDAIIYYGNRSVLNYRRIPPSDPARGRYRWELLEPCMAQTVRTLLLAGVPVYFVEDASPPLADSLVRLQKYFSLQKVEEGSTVYRIQLPPPDADYPLPGTCPLSIIS